VVNDHADTVWQRLALARQGVARSFGKRVIPLIVTGVYTSVRWMGNLAMRLDPIFFRGLGKVDISRPIVIVGNPRTGTTFLQRWLHDQGVGRGMQLFRMIYPALLQQRLIEPFMPIIKRIDPTRFHATAAHKTGLDAVETDDAAFLSRFADGFLYYAFFLAHDDVDHQPLMDPDYRDTVERDLALLDKLWRRNQYGQKDSRVLAKLFSLSARLPAFQAKYPEARVLFMARDPVQQIPSTMSLVTGVLDNAFGFWDRPDAWRARYLERLYAGLVELMRRFHDDWAEGRIDRDGVFVVPFHRLMADFEGLMGDMLDFVGHAPDTALLEQISARGEKQRAYKSKHAYDLAQFGLSEEKIRKDCAFFYKEFLPDLWEESMGSDEA